MKRGTVGDEADGLSMKGQLFAGDGEGRRAAVLIFPEASGLSEHTVGCAERLAGAG